MDDVRIISSKRLGIYGQTAADVWILMSEKSSKLMNISVSDGIVTCQVFGIWKKTINAPLLLNLTHLKLFSTHRDTLQRVHKRRLIKTYTHPPCFVACDEFRVSQKLLMQKELYELIIIK